MEDLDDDLEVEEEEDLSLRLFFFFFFLRSSIAASSGSSSFFVFASSSSAMVAIQCVDGEGGWFFCCGCLMSCSISFVVGRSCFVSK